LTMYFECRINKNALLQTSDFALCSYISYLKEKTCTDFHTVVRVFDLLLIRLTVT